MKIEGNTFIVTGGLGGIGTVVAKGLLDKGANVGIFDVIPDDKAAGTWIKGQSESRVFYRKVDISDVDDSKNAVEAVVEKLGNLKGVVHCAAISIKRKWTNKMADSIPDFVKMWNVNSLGTFVINAQVADAINKDLNEKHGDKFWTTEEERGVIVNFSSAAAHGLYSRNLTYGVTKAAVAGMTRIFSDFLGPSGIRVNSISPSIVMSPMVQDSGKYFMDDLKDHAAFPRVPVPAEKIAHAVQFLIENGWVNGEDVRVDGGWRLVINKNADSVDFRETIPGLE